MKGATQQRVLHNKGSHHLSPHSQISGTSAVSGAAGGCEPKMSGGSDPWEFNALSPPQCGEQHSSGPDISLTTQIWGKITEGSLTELTPVVSL